MVPSSNENEFKKEKRAVIIPTNEISTFAAENRVKVILFLLEEQSIKIT